MAGHFPKKNTSYDVAHVKAAQPMVYIMLAITGILSGLIIIGGIYATFSNLLSPTQLSLLGFTINTGSVGVALIGLGLIIMYFVFSKILKSIRYLASLPEDK